MISQVTKHELRCTCSRKPLLCVYGINDEGKPYLHFLAHKQRRPIMEVYIDSGSPRFKCKECLRWWEVVIRSTGKATLREEKVPAPLLDSAVNG